MSLLLKALAQVDSRSRTPFAAVEEVQFDAAMVGPDQCDAKPELDKRQQPSERVDEPVPELYFAHPAISTATFDLNCRSDSSTDFSVAADGALIASALSPTKPSTIRVRKLISAATAITTVASPRAAPDAASESTAHNFAAIDAQLLRLNELLGSVTADVGQPSLEPIQNPKGAPIELPVVSVQPLAAPLPQVRDEYRELCDSVASRLELKKHATLIFVDGGRQISDATWLWPLCASLLQQLVQQPKTVTRASRVEKKKILLVEAAGDECGITRQLGLSSAVGLSEILRGSCTWRNALRPTYHPQIQLMSLGSHFLTRDDGTALVELWGELKQQFDLLLVAVGPLAASQSTSGSSSDTSVAALFLTLADAAVLCVELDGTPALQAGFASQLLQRSGVNLLGCVVRGEAAA